MGIKEQAGKNLQLQSFLTDLKNRSFEYENEPITCEVDYHGIKTVNIEKNGNLITFTMFKRSWEEMGKQLSPDHGDKRLIINIGADDQLSCDQVEVFGNTPDNLEERWYSPEADTKILNRTVEPALIVLRQIPSI